MTDATDSDGTASAGDASPGDEPQQSVRETARLRAHDLRQELKKQDRRRRLLFRGGIAVGIVAVLAVVALVLVNVVQPSGRGPANMSSDGIVIGKELRAVRSAGIVSGGEPAPAPSPDDGRISIKLYVDYFSPEAAEFQQANSEQLRSWLDDDLATLEIHPLAIIPAQTGGTQYSQRAANAVACVAQFAPDSFFDVHEGLLQNVPAPDSAGLDDSELKDIVKASGARSLEAIDRCIDSKRFRTWVQSASARAVNGPVAGTELATITDLPTVLFGGRQYVVADPSDDRAVLQAFAQAAGEAYNDSSTSTPTPSPSETPAG